MAQKRPRISVGVMAVCCGVLSLTVVARDSSSHSEAGANSRKYAAVHHRSVHPGSSVMPLADASATDDTAVTTPYPPTPKGIESERRRMIRETFSYSAPASAESSTSSKAFNRIRSRRMDQKMRNIPSPLVFMPSRGRRFGDIEAPIEKRQITIEQMLEKGDYFVPNRGKKTPTTGDLIKKGKFDELLSGTADEYFFPNRGKKQYLLSYDSGSNVRPLLNRGPLPFERKFAVHAMPGSVQQLQHPVESRLRRNLLENLANEHKDTFFSSRGKRLRPLMEELIFVPGTALPDDTRQEHIAQDALSNEQTEEFSGESNELDALLWNENVLLPMDRPVS
uniref:Uncharacterized protein n=1 Tax=Anopheles farauti TaxID=69004 RepID=A0A182QNG9_9DIPT